MLEKMYAEHQRYIAVRCEDGKGKEIKAGFCALRVEKAARRGEPEGGEEER